MIGSIGHRGTALKTAWNVSIFAIMLLLVRLLRAKRVSAGDGGFRWTDLRQDTERVAAVSKALEGEKYTALREIAVVGDAALVITSTRANPTAKPEQDQYSAYSLDLKSPDEKPDLLMTGTRLQFRDWLRFIREGETELVDLRRLQRLPRYHFSDFVLHRRKNEEVACPLAKGSSRCAAVFCLTGKCRQNRPGIRA